MKIETKLEFKPYLKLMYALTFRKPVTLAMMTLSIAMVISSLLYFGGVSQQFYTEPPYFTLALGLIVMAMLPLSVASSARKHFNRNSSLTEPIAYTFTDKGIGVKGETFESEFGWDKVMKVVEMKGWLLIYQNRAVANAIPKLAFTAGQLQEFRTMVATKKVRRKIK